MDVPVAMELDDSLSRKLGQLSKDLGACAQQFFLQAGTSALEPLHEAERQIQRLTLEEGRFLEPELPEPGKLAWAEGHLQEVLQQQSERQQATKQAILRSSMKFTSALSAAQRLFGTLPDAAEALNKELAMGATVMDRWYALTNKLQKLYDQLSQATTKAQLQEWMTLEVGPPKSESERLAKENLENGRVSQGALLEVLQASKLKDVKPHSRPGAAEKCQGRSISLGLATWGAGSSQTTTHTREHPYLLRLAVAHYRQRFEEPITSVVIAQDFETDEHVDNNVGTSKVMALGDFTGGRLFVEKDAKLDSHEEDQPHSYRASEAFKKGGRPYEEGEEVQGYYIKTHGLLRVFNAYYLHWTEPFQGGPRFTITYYTSRSVLTCKEIDRVKLEKELNSAGMRWPTQQQLKACKDARASTVEYKKVCYPSNILASVAAKPRKGAAQAQLAEDPAPSAGQSAGRLANESPAALMPAIVEAQQLLAVNSNYRGGNGTEMCRKQAKLLQRRVDMLNDQPTKQWINLLLTEMLIPAGRKKEAGTFMAKTPGTWRVYVLEILESLEVGQEELEEMKKTHKLTKKEVAGSKDTKAAVLKLQKLKRSWGNGCPKRKSKEISA
ncbi:unnamed protein product [Effrenium voratum]|nr:unnamed protein product [Effrenium voratum]